MERMMSKLDFSNYKIQLARDVNSDKLIFLKTIREWDKPTQSMLKNASAKAMKAGEQPLRCLICNQPLQYVESITQKGHLKHLVQTDEVYVPCILRQESESHFKDSDSDSESSQHLYLKLSAAKALGITEGVSELSVETKLARPDAYTGKYKYKIPDVQFVYGGMKYALEVQLSGQKSGDIQEREDYYSKANCQLIWLCHIDESRKSLDIRFNSTSKALFSDINQGLLNEWKTGFKIARVSPIRFEIQWVEPKGNVGSWEMVPSFREDYLDLDELSISNMNADDSVWGPFEPAVGSVQEYLSQDYSEKLDSISRFSESNKHRSDVDSSKVAKRFLYDMGCMNETSISLVESIYECINNRYLIHTINQPENVLHAIGTKAVENEKFSVILCAAACCYGLVEQNPEVFKELMMMAKDSMQQTGEKDEIIISSDNHLLRAIQIFPALAHCVDLDNDSFDIFDVISFASES